MFNSKEYMTCTSESAANELIKAGFSFLYDQNGVWYFENEPELSNSFKFSDGKNFKDSGISFTKRLNF